MKSHVNIVTVVDVIGALSDRSLLNGNLCMMDNGEHESAGQGTAHLCTVCRPGQVIQWVVYALDLQTPVDIKSITFLSSDSRNGEQSYPCPPGPTSSGGKGDESEKLGLYIWSGVVPPSMVPGVVHKYRLEFQMYEGVDSVLSIDSCSLRCL